MEIEHCIPVAMVLTRKRKRADTKRGITTEACTFCNQALGAAFFGTMKERIMHVQSKVAVKRKKHSRMPYWSDEELLELEPELRAQILRSQREMEFLDAASLWPNSTPYRAFYQTAFCQNHFNPEHPRYSTTIVEFFKGINQSEA